MKEKRYQECNPIHQLWRRRWLLLIPIKYLWHTIFFPIKIRETEIKNGKVVDTDKYFFVEGENLKKILKGSAQIKMKHYYSTEEVFKRIKDKYGI